MRSVAFHFVRRVPLVSARIKFSSSLRHLAACLLLCCGAAQGVLADSITYQQLRQNRGGRALTSASLPVVARTTGQQSQGQNPSGQSGGVVQESQNHPEFVRLPDGRIVRYGPGIICDENCVEPVAPATFREPKSPNWLLISPLVAGGALCAVLCRPSGVEARAQSTPPIIIPQPQPTATVVPTPMSTPPPNEIPEPGTLLLFGLGLGAMLARKRKAATKNPI